MIDSRTIRWNAAYSAAFSAAVGARDAEHVPTEELPSIFKRATDAAYLSELAFVQYQLSLSSKKERVLELVLEPKALVFAMVSRYTLDAVRCTLCRGFVVGPDQTVRVIWPPVVPGVEADPSGVEVGPWCEQCLQMVQDLAERPSSAQPKEGT